jgi:MoxR-like ATPase
MLKVNVSYPSFDEEKEMYKKNLANETIKVEKILSKKDVFSIQELVNEVFVSASIFEYVMNLVDSTRNPEKYGLENLKKYLNF